MENSPLHFHFPRDIEVKSNPLLEAWLEIRWQLEPGPLPDQKRDPAFPFALGVFYNSIRDTFPYKRDLDASRLPPDMLPYVVRHQFWKAENEWPILQLGPGVASVNFTKPYNWDLFKEKALYLRDKLLDAYENADLGVQSLTLRYRNGVPFDYRDNDYLGFLRENLNTSLTMPDHIPGAVSTSAWPIDGIIRLVYDLLAPAGKGTLQIASATRKQPDPSTGEVIEQGYLLWQLEVQSEGSNAANLSSEAEYSAWLTSAHAVIHEWFFSLIEGPLFDQYKGG